MRIFLLLDAATPATRIRDALAQRGHDVRVGDHGSIDALASADLIVGDAEPIARGELISRLAADAPGIAFLLIGPECASHPDVVAQLDRPVDLARLLAAVDEVADVLDGSRLREPTDVVAYETLFAGDSPQIRELIRHVRIVARSEAPVWIYGEDGSGRAIIARAIHDRSARRGQPFVAVNTAAYPDEQLGARLFGGSEAAAIAARNGTLFIERIGAMGPHTQRELVRHLESGAADPASPRMLVGIQRDRAVDGAQLVSRELYYRLKVLEVEIPTLQERARDLEHIVGRMLERLGSDGAAPRIADKAMLLLGRYQFPGNLLELAHALTHAFVLARGGEIQPEHLPLSIRAIGRDDDDGAPVPEGELEALDIVAKRFERDYLLRVLRSVGGNRGRAAEILGLTRKGLWGKLKAHGISDDDIERVDPS